MAVRVVFLSFSEEAVRQRPFRQPPPLLTVTFCCPCPLVGAERTSLMCPLMSANDP